MITIKNLHLLWRSGFGPNFNQIKSPIASTKELWEMIKEKSQEPLEYIFPSDSFVQNNYDKVVGKGLSKSEKETWNRRIRTQSAKDLKDLNSKWIKLMINNPNQLGEKMSFFWHHHFAIRHANSFLQQDALNAIRKNALGNFGNLLREVSKSGAMILSLNNQQNRKSSPNENFAREIMELFTMGLGNYTEADVKEIARAFTGWSISPAGRFEFKAEYHDRRIKTFLGESGNFDGDDVIDIILKQPQTAKFIVTKIYTYFVNNEINDHHIDQLSATFFKNYDILQLLENIFTSDWFFNEKNIGNRIKAPIDLLVGAQRFSPFKSPEIQLHNQLQKLLGQILFYPPSIAGWPTAKNWMDCSTLMVRLQLPQILNGDITINLKAKANDDVNMGRENTDEEVNITNNQEIVYRKEWEVQSAKLSHIDIASMMVIPKLSDRTIQLLQSKADGDNTVFALSLMSLPEYQLC